ncbi:porin [uncultured Draconibacterium sp.]|uniref:porin n=1 Tax=uncultured Draconibacterium sp. TaxID=1573823 RepID=UPI0032619B4F
MKRVFTIITLMVVLINQGFAQDDEFVPSGSGFATIFANFHQGVTNASSDESAFELVRGYLGYEYNFSPNFYAKINLDIGSPEDLSDYAKERRYAYFKNAYLRYTEGKLQVEFGLIGLKQFKQMEKVWERRYLMKTFADEYKLGSSADLGVNFNYKVSDSWDVDFTIMNGEGYNNIQTDGIFKYALGTTIKLPKNFTSRFYYDMTNDEVVQSTYHIFISYDFNGKANLGGEGIYRENDDWDEGYERYGYSLYGKYNLNKKYQLFARYDVISSNKVEGEENPWNLAKDGSALVAGIQFTPIKNIKFALNYHDWVPYAANAKTDAFIYLNLEVKL